jgi:hypothetical protein
MRRREQEGREERVSRKRQDREKTEGTKGSERDKTVRMQRQEMIR